MRKEEFLSWAKENDIGWYWEGSLINVTHNSKDTICFEVDPDDYERIKEEIEDYLSNYKKEEVRPITDDKEIYKFLKKDIQEEDTIHYIEAGYDSWFNFLSDSYIQEDNYEQIEKVLGYEINEHWEQLWKETHEYHKCGPETPEVPDLL